jgi:predicted ATP-dependent endonuclease of OLD family
MEFILAIEEPESHLHPSAIHQLKAVLSEMAQKSQVIMTTHCPLFVERTSISSNILVHQNKAVPAKNIAEIRGILGVRASDNLQHAEVIIVVEGEEDRRALRALFTYHSKSLGGALAQGSLGIESLQGATNLSYKLSTLREALCVTHSFLDYDAAGIKAAKKATADGLLEIKDVHYTTCEGLQEAEFEDLLDESLYASMLQKKYGVSTLSPKFKGSKKWSDRLAAAFKHQGKPWSDVIEAKVKDDVSTLIEDSPGNALNAHRRSIFDALVAELEDKLRVIEASKKSKN